MLSVPTTIEIQGILDQVRSWPRESRLSLVREVMATLESPAAPIRERRTLKDLYGILKVDGPIPTDEDCERMLEEERMARYGR